jgi:hypothetical protein
VTSVLAATLATLRTLAGSWHGRALTVPERRALVAALAGSRFYELAAAVAAPLPAGDARARELAAYRDFIVAIAAVNQRFYPRVAHGLTGYAHDYDAAVLAAARRLWIALGRPAPAFGEERFFALIRARFGAEGYLGNTVEYHGLLVGHVVQDERRRVEQYGRAAEVRFLSLDRLLSRDFTSWYGTTNVGGWGSASTIVQVRAAYLDEPFRRLGWVTSDAQRRQLRADIARREQEDRVRCAADRYAEPTSLAPRLKLQAAMALWDRLGRRGLDARTRSLAFVAESLRLNVEATVFAHEGRHALDQRHFKKQFAAWDDGERELRAKLSEVAFAPDPLLALTGSILGAGLDESSGHGQANRRFLHLLADWMAAHAGDDTIEGLDRAQPLLMQVDRLSAAQLVALVRAADPMARAPAQAQP